jgi:hypothetical protein
MTPQEVQVVIDETVKQTGEAQAEKDAKARAVQEAEQRFILCGLSPGTGKILSAWGGAGPMDGPAQTVD